jgi:hypothetical protein
MALHVKPVKVNGKTKYKVHAVGDHLKDGIKVGEHLSDTQLDDATEMGAKIKHLKEDTIEEKKLTPAEIKKREEVAKAIARENPKMPMAKKMAIATATAKKVAEEQSINEDEVEMDEELSELLSAIYENLSDEGKEIFEDIVENNPEKMLEFLEQLELTDGV